MAKKILELFRDSAETQYDTGSLPLLGLAGLNKGVKFGLIEPAKGDVDTVKFHIQRAKRLKAGAVPAKTGGKAATDAIALLDTAKKVDWDTVDVLPSTKRALIVNVSAFEENEITEDNSTFMRALNGTTSNTLIEAEELATASVIAAGAKSALDVTSHDKTVESIETAIEKIELLVDDFKAYSAGVVVLVHPSIAKVFSKVQGQSYQTGTNTFPNGLGKSFRYDGIDFFVSPILNAIESTKDKVAGAIVMDKEAYANAGLNKRIKSFDQMIADERFIGKTYHSLDVVIDPKRIAVLEIAKLAADQSKKVNA